MNEWKLFLRDNNNISNNFWIKYLNQFRCKTIRIEYSFIDFGQCERILNFLIIIILFSSILSFLFISYLSFLLIIIFINIIDMIFQR